jgi:hypothetical protein
VSTGAAAALTIVLSHPEIPPLVLVGEHPSDSTEVAPDEANTQF